MAYRLDVANAFLHDAKLTDNPAIPAGRARLRWNGRRRPTCSGIFTTPIWRRTSARAGCGPPPGRGFDDRFVFGEFSEEFERSGCYLPPDKGLHAGYNFALLMASDAAGILAHLKTLARYPDHWPCIAFSNHDVIRTATRFGAGSAKVMLALLFALRGTVLLYQGEELGLPEVDLAPRPAQGSGGRSLLSRCSRAAMAAARPCPGMRPSPIWDFPPARPGCRWGRSMRALAVSEQEKDPASALAFTRTLLKARKTHPALREGDLELLDARIRCWPSSRGEDKLLCVFNLSDAARPWTCPGRPKCRSAPATGQARPGREPADPGPPSSAWFGTALDAWLPAPLPAAAARICAGRGRPRPSKARIGVKRAPAACRRRSACPRPPSASAASPARFRPTARPPGSPPRPGSGRRPGCDGPGP